MNEIIADITKNLMEELDNRELSRNKVNMLVVLEEYYESIFIHITNNLDDPGALMNNLVAVKQMIDTLNHFNK